MYEEFEHLCTNCGLCCKIPTTGEYCKHVKVMPDKTTRCKIYKQPDRIGTHIGDGYICWYAMEAPTLWDDCPYNNIKIAQMIKNANKGILEIIHENA